MAENQTIDLLYNENKNFVIIFMFTGQKGGNQDMYKSRGKMSCYIHL